MMLVSLCITITLLPYVFSDEGHHYASVASLNRLLRVDQKIVKILKQYLQKITDSDLEKVIRRYIKTSRKFSKLCDSNLEPFHHPINGFHFLKHTVYNWKDVYSALQRNNESESVMYALTKTRDTILYPSSKDVLFGAASITRLQHTYRFPMEKLVKGVIEDKHKVFQSIEPLNAWDCNEIGKGAVLLNIYESATKWFEIAKQNIELEDKSISIETVIKNKEHAKTLFSNWIPPDKRSRELDTDEEFAEKAEDPVFRNYIRRNRARLLEPMAALCRGENLELPFPKPTLSCQYFTRDHAFFKIGPLKMEQLSEKPGIFMLHNFLMEKEMQKFVQIATPKLQASRHFGSSKKLNQVVSLRRTAKIHWFLSDDKKLETKVHQRIEAAFGVKLEKYDPPVDPIQLVNYGYAGAYTPHLDFLFGTNELSSRRITGDRIATFMAYLGNVTLGGSTVFPLVGVSVPPKRGAALFWFNTYKSGEGDLLHMHGACPVVYGSKWTINKWISSYDQMFKYPCGSRYLDRYKLLS